MTTLTTYMQYDLIRPNWISGEDGIWYLPRDVTIIQSSAKGEKWHSIRFRGVAWKVGLTLNEYRRSYPVGQIIQHDDNSTYFADIEYVYDKREAAKFTQTTTIFGSEKN